MRSLGIIASRRLATLAIAALVVGCARPGGEHGSAPDSAATPSPETASAPPNDRMSAPASAPGVTQGADLEGAAWYLVSGTGDSATSSDSARRATITFDAATKRVTGSGGCNRISGTYERNADSLRFSPIIATRMACPQGMERETAFLNALGATRTYAIRGDTLVFDNEARVNVAKLVREPK